MSGQPEQVALFDAPAKPRRKTWAQRLEEIVPRYAPGEPRPWDPIDEAAVEIRMELGRA